MYYLLYYVLTNFQQTAGNSMLKKLKILLSKWGSENIFSMLWLFVLTLKIYLEKRFKHIYGSG